jgi:hypothetical protein
MTEPLLKKNPTGFMPLAEPISFATIARIILEIKSALGLNIGNDPA